MSVLVTGAANGLGAALSRQAKNRGQSVIGLDRAWEGEESDLEVTVDLADLLSLDALMPVLAAKGPYSLVIHNAAISATGQFEEIPASVHCRLIDINVTAPLMVTRALIKADALVEGSVLVFIASLSVHVGYPGAVSYAASKAALANYADSLRKALRPRSIHVLTVFPGPMKTDQAARHAPAGADAEKRMDSDEVAALIFDAIDKKRATLVPGAANRMFAFAGRIMPGFMRRMMKKIIYDKLDRSVYEGPPN